MGTEWHFPVMIAAALAEFLLVLRLALGREHTPFLPVPSLADLLA